MFKCDILRSIFSGMLQNFWVRFSITPIRFQCFELGQQQVLDGTVMYYKLEMVNSKQLFYKIDRFKRFNDNF